MAVVLTGSVRSVMFANVVVALVVSAVFRQVKRAFRRDLTSVKLAAGAVPSSVSIARISSSGAVRSPARNPTRPVRGVPVFASVSSVMSVGSRVVVATAAGYEAAIAQVIVTV